jgi:hypothetical protein
MRTISPPGLALTVACAGLLCGCGGAPVPRGFVTGVSDVDGLELADVDAACSGTTTDTERIPVTRSSSRLMSTGAARAESGSRRPYSFQPTASTTAVVAGTGSRN